MNIDWSILNGAPNVAAAFQSGYQGARAQRRQEAEQDALAAYGANPAAGPSPQLWALNSQAAALAARNSREVAADSRQAQARAMVPDVLAGLGLNGESASSGPAATGSNGDVVVTAPVKHKTIADVYALDADLASALIPRIGDLQEQDRKRLGFEADVLAMAAFAARQAPYEKRREIIDRYRPQLTRSGFTQAEIDDFDPSDDALAGAITQSLGIKEALNQALAQQKFDWQREDDRIDNARDDRRVAIQDRSARDTSARGWSADRRAERRFERGDGMKLDMAPTGDLLNMLENQ